MKIKEIKSYLRPIEKLDKDGVESLSNEELLAILINTGSTEKSCIELARDILNSLNSLNDLLYINKSQLMNFKGIKDKKASVIVSAIELVKRASKDVKKGIEIVDKKTIYNILKPQIEGLTYEKLFVFFLDVKCRLIKLSTYSEEAASFTKIPARQIVNEAMNLKSSMIILAHNHPSGDLRPSANDISSTEAFEKVLSTLSIHLLDHVIVSSEGSYSLKDNYDII